MYQSKYASFTLLKTGKIRAGGGPINSMSRIQFNHTYDSIISVENLLGAWKDFLKGKKKRKDVQEFERDLMANIISLHNDLQSKTYKHSVYEFFRIYDPKLRDIHKATVRDRVLHRAVYRELYRFFDKTFIADSFSCRMRKGTHKAIDRFRSFARKASRNHTMTVWVLKCDIRKFFASIDQNILKEIVKLYVYDRYIRKLLLEITNSFSSGEKGVGLPLGNLTSQLFVNIYMNEFDQYVKHKMKAKHYIRYADDFVIISRDREWLCNLIPQIGDFLWYRLKLRLHPDKVSIGTIAAGVDYLGWVSFPDHRIVRTLTKKRMFRRLKDVDGKVETVRSYLGLLKHGNAKMLRDKVESMKTTHKRRDTV